MAMPVCYLHPFIYSFTYLISSNTFLPGKFTDDVINLLRANSDVEYIEEDSIVSADALVTQCVHLNKISLFCPDIYPSSRTNAPWGLARISQDERLVNQDANALTFTYRHDSSAGAGVDFYVVGAYRSEHYLYARAQLSPQIPVYLSSM